MTYNTIFDDVFRTMFEKMPKLVIPVINEVFHTSYNRKRSHSTGTNITQNRKDWCYYGWKSFRT